MYHNFCNIGFYVGTSITDISFFSIKRNKNIKMFQLFLFSSLFFFCRCNSNQTLFDKTYIVKILYCLHLTVCSYCKNVSVNIYVLLRFCYICMLHKIQTEKLYNLLGFSQLKVQFVSNSGPLSLKFIN